MTVDLVSAGTALAGRGAAALAGTILIGATTGSAIKTMILPRAVASRISRAVFRVVRLAYSALLVGARFPRRDRVLASYAPVALLTLLGVWLTTIAVAFAALDWAVGGTTVRAAIELSGSSIFTLGFAHPPDLPTTLLSFGEAAFGPLVLALMISYLPSIYSAFSRREAVVASLETPAGSPPAPATFITRLWRIHGLDGQHDLWHQWQTWFVELQETHVSFPALAFFRSPQPEHNWVTAAGALLDTAALMVSTVDRPDDPDAQLCLRAGWLALRRVAAYFGLDYPGDSTPSDPISVTRAEYDHVVAELTAAGVPLKADPEAAWRAFAGWRVNYDASLLYLSALVSAPPAGWTASAPDPR